MISNTKKALMCSLWIAENYPGAMPEIWGNNEMGALQLAIDVDTPEMWESITVALGVEFAYTIGQYMATLGEFETAIRVRNAKDKIKLGS